MQTLSCTYNDRVNEIHRKYFEIISPFIIQLEVLDGEFPIEILNEIRAVFGHLSKAHLNNEASIVEHNIEKADSHIKRAILDCYKYLCLAYDDKYKEFSNKYINVDLSVVGDGEFLPLLCQKRNNAIQKLSNAKKLEISKTNENDLYNAYEDAYNAYADTYNYIEAFYEKLERLKHKTDLRDISAKRWYLIGTIAGVTGAVAGIIGFIVGFFK